MCTDVQKDILEKVANNEASELKLVLSTSKLKIDFVDENGMTPLQHAAYKGNIEICQMLLDQVRPIQTIINCSILQCCNVI